jgi:hypothetical protein
MAGAHRRGVCLLSTAAEEGVRKNRRESCRGARALQGKLSGGGSWEREVISSGAGSYRCPHRPIMLHLRKFLTGKLLRDDVEATIRSHGK